MNILKNLSYDKDIAADKDIVSSGGYVLPSDVYVGTVVHAYLSESKNGAHALNVGIKIGEKEFKETLYFTNRNGQNYYEKDGKKAYLPSFNHVEAMCQFACDKPLSDMSIKEKTIKLYNFESKQEELTEVPMLTELVGKEIGIALMHERTNKTKWDGNEYAPTSEAREFNSIAKVLNPSNLKTLNEHQSDSEATFVESWKEKFAGEIKDSFKDIAPKPKASTKPLFS